MVDDKAKKIVEKGVKSNTRWIVFWSVVFAVAAIIIVASIVSQARVDTGGEVKVTEVRALTCRSDSYFYPMLGVDDADAKDFKIIATFVGDNVRSLSLQQVLYYDSEERILKGEAEKHAELNKHFGRDGMQADALNASFATIGDGLRVGIYETYSQMEPRGMKYFLLEENTKYDYTSIEEVYTGLGLKCDDSK